MLVIGGLIFFLLFLIGAAAIVYFVIHHAQEISGAKTAPPRTELPAVAMVPKLRAPEPVAVSAPALPPIAEGPKEAAPAPAGPENGTLTVSAPAAGTDYETLVLTWNGPLEGQVAENPGHNESIPLRAEPETRHLAPGRYTVDLIGEPGRVSPYRFPQEYVVHADAPAPAIAIPRTVAGKYWGLLQFDAANAAKSVFVVIDVAPKARELVIKELEFAHDQTDHAETFRAGGAPAIGAMNTASALALKSPDTLSFSVTIEDIELDASLKLHPLASSDGGSSVAADLLLDPGDSAKSDAERENMRTRMLERLRTQAEFVREQNDQLFRAEEVANYREHHDIALLAAYQRLGAEETYAKHYERLRTTLPRPPKAAVELYAAETPLTLTPSSNGWSVATAK
jgi:hypothetical protein